jgi:hypothetical protein
MIEQILATLKADEFVGFSMNPNGLALRVVVRKGSLTEFAEATFSVLLSEISSEATGYDAWHGTLLSLELERTLKQLRSEETK